MIHKICKKLAEIRACISGFSRKKGFMTSFANIFPALLCSAFRANLYGVAHNRSCLDVCTINFTIRFHQYFIQSSQLVYCYESDKVTRTPFFVQDRRIEDIELSEKATKLTRTSEQRKACLALISHSNSATPKLNYLWPLPIFHATGKLIPPIKCH